MSFRACCCRTPPLNREANDQIQLYPEQNCTDRIKRTSFRRKSIRQRVALLACDIVLEWWAADCCGILGNSNSFRFPLRSLYRLRRQSGIPTSIRSITDRTSNELPSSFFNAVSVSTGTRTVDPVSKASYRQARRLESVRGLIDVAISDKHSFSGESFHVSIQLFLIYFNMTGSEVRHVSKAILLARLDQVR